MMSNLSRAYSRNADQCAEVARTSKLGSIREQQLGAEKAWRALAERAFATERKAVERSSGSTHKNVPGEGRS